MEGCRRRTNHATALTTRESGKTGLAGAIRVSDPTDSLHPLVKSHLQRVLKKKLSAGNEVIPRDGITQRMKSRFADADAASDLNVFGAKAIIADP